MPTWLSGNPSELTSHSYTYSPNVSGNRTLPPGPRLPTAHSHRAKSFTGLWPPPLDNLPGELGVGACFDPGAATEAVVMSERSGKYFLSGDEFTLNRVEHRVNISGCLACFEKHAVSSIAKVPLSWPLGRQMPGWVRSKDNLAHRAQDVLKEPGTVTRLFVTQPLSLPRLRGPCKQLTCPGL